MNQKTSEHTKLPPVPYGSHLIRLNWNEILTALIAILLFCWLVPALWSRIEPVSFGKDYRIPYTLSNDYWMFERYCQSKKQADEILAVGDSVVWGEFVSPGQTLSHYLGEETNNRFSNMGVNGTHPMALEGLMHYYGRFNTKKKILFHFNPLWMSSPRHDLQTKKEFNFNHPKLVPQFTMNVPCYRASFSDRFSIVFEHRAPFMQWVNHLRVAFFDNLDFPSWTFENPYANPAARIQFSVLEPSQEFRHEPISWEKRGIQKQDFDWVALKDSMQWAAFKRTVNAMSKRGHSVLVIAGPFNEHLLKEQSRMKYRQILSGIKTELTDEKIAHWIPEALPTSLYADTSHPLKEGYALLAQQLIQSNTFKTWNGKVDDE